MKEDMKEKIIIALDYDEFEDAKQAVDRLKEAVFFKVGLQAFIRFGDDIISYLKERDKKIFLDLKFKDIPNTVHGAVKSSTRYSPAFLTVHMSGGGEMVRKAVEAAQSSPGLTILGVTVLTSLSDEDLKDTGIHLSARDTVLRLCELGLKNGLNAFVCSPMEIEPIRQHFGPGVILVTPGIRPQGSEKGDQKRVFTPRNAIDAGSNFLVIGRPITQAGNPGEAFDSILKEITGITV
jgi:orotidine-5'-phosphate decarboxylase